MVRQQIRDTSPGNMLCCLGLKRAVQGPITRESGSWKPRPANTESGLIMARNHFHPGAGGGNMQFNHRKAIGLAGLIIGVIFVWACASQGPVVRQTGNLAKIEKITILPFENMTALHGANTGVSSPITGRVFVSGPVIDRGDQIMTELLVSHIQRDTDFKIVPSRDASAIMDSLIQRQGREWPRRKLVARTGQRLGADAVFIGHVYRLRERTGGGAASESPSSVAFDIYLIDCRQERVMWSAFYDYTQQALSENLGGIGNFFRRGGRWVTVEELATAAMEDIFADFPPTQVAESES